MKRKTTCRKATQVRKRIGLCMMLSLVILTVNACKESDMEGYENAESSYEMSEYIVPHRQDESNTKESVLASQENVTVGTEHYRDFVIDNVLHSEKTGDIHYHVYVPESYDGSSPYPIFFTLPGYEALYFQGVAENLKAEGYAFEARKYISDMIIVAPQLSDWGEVSAEQTIELTEFFLTNYNIDSTKVYVNGYSGGGETMSIVLEKSPELFTAYLHCSSRWDGDYELIVENQIPIYLAIGESDEYYGSESTKETYRTLHELYAMQGLSESEIDQILVLDVKPDAYFQERGVENQHAGGLLFAYDESIMNWLFQ